MPIITIGGQKYLDELRFGWKKLGKLLWDAIIPVCAIVGVIGTLVQILSSTHLMH